MIYIDGLGYVNEDVTSVANRQNDSINATGVSTDSFQKILSSVTNPLNVPESLEEFFSNAAKEYGVDENLLKAVAKQESNYETDVVSHSGATGVMQLMPSTASSMGVSDATNPEQNILGGAKLLSQLLDKYNGDLSLTLAAYNAGSGAVDKYNGVPPYEETKNYVNKVTDYYKKTVDNVSSQTNSAIPADTVNDTISKDTASNLAITNEDSVNDSAVSLLKEYLASHTSSTANTDGSYTYDDYLRFVDEYIDIISTFGDPIGESDTNSSTDTSGSSDDGFDLSALYQTVSSSLPSNSSVLNLLQSTLAKTKES